MYSKIIKFLTQAIIISQLFFLPTSSTVFGMDSSFKLFIFGFLLLLLLVFYFLRIVHKNELTINKSGIFVALSLFLFSVLLSAVFGIDKSLSIFATNGGSGYSIVYLLFLLTFFFITITYYQTKDNISFLLRTFLFSYTFLILSCYITFLSYLFNFSFTPVLEKMILLSVGSFYDLAMYVAIVSVFVFAVSINNVGAKLLFPNHDAIKFLRLLLFFSILILVLVNFLPAWITVLSGIVPVLFFYKVLNSASGWEVVEKKELIKKMFYVFLVIFFLILNLSNISNQIFARQMSKDLKLDYSTSVSIAAESIKNNPILGNGGESFHYVFSKYRSEEMNALSIWNLRYKRSISYFLEMFSSFGVLGVLVFLSLVLLLLRAIFVAAVFIVQKYKDKGNISQLGVLIGLMGALVSLVVAHFVYSAGMMIIFVFFLFIAFLFVYSRSLGIKSRSLNSFRVITRSNEPRLFIFLAAKVFATIIIITVFTSYNFKSILASVYYTSLAVSENRLEKIVSLNPYDYLYSLELANYYKNQIKKEISGPVGERDGGRVEVLYKKLETLCGLLSEKKSASVVVQETIAKIYHDLESLIPGTYKLAIDYYHKALVLEPSNPVVHYYLAQSYLLGKDSEKAEMNFRLALDRKSDYNIAKFSLAKLLGDVGRSEEAIELLDDLNLELYRGEEVYYQLGKIYFNTDRVDLSILNFEKVLLISPNHSNALYSLVLVYEKLEDKGKAAHYLNKVIRLNPDNVDLVEKLEKLKN